MHLFYTRYPHCITHVSCYQSSIAHARYYCACALLLQSIATVRPDQFDFSFHGPDRPKILGTPPPKKRCVNAWPNCSRSWLQPALTSMFSSAIIRPRTIVKQSIAGRNLWRGDLQAQPEECGVINEIHTFFFFFFLPTYRLIFWQN